MQGDNENRYCRGLVWNPYPENAGSANVRYYACTCGASSWDLSQVPGSDVPSRGAHDLECCNCGNIETIDFGVDVYWEAEPYIPNSVDDELAPRRVDN